MQDRYTGDIGDFIKLAILRRLCADRRLGVIWWLYPDESHNADGRHTAYLSDSQKWRGRDPELFDALKQVVDGARRRVSALEDAGVLNRARFYRHLIPTVGPAAARRAGRAAWFHAAQEYIAECDLVFLDPDNGLETARFDPGASKAGKSVALAELTALRSQGRAIIVYHHQTRMAGGHVAELSHWGRRLSGLGFSVDALRASAFSARAFFLLDADYELQSRAKQMAEEWGDKLTWHPHLGFNGH